MGKVRGGRRVSVEVRKQGKRLGIVVMVGRMGMGVMVDVRNVLDLLVKEKLV
jgi:hypothetical protein